MNSESHDHPALHVRPLVRTLVPALVAGSGFAASFGWIWFPDLSAHTFAALPGVFSGTLLSGGGVTLLALALLAGLTAVHLAGHRLSGRSHRALAALLHGAAAACTTAGLLVSEATPHGAALLFGVSAAAAGSYWMARLLALPPLRTGAALLTAALLAWVAAPVCVASAAALPIGVCVALGLSLLPIPLPPRGISAHPVAHHDATPVMLLCASWFAFGIMAAAFPAPTGTTLPFHAAGIALAIICSGYAKAKVETLSLLAASMGIPAVLWLAFAPGRFGVVEFTSGIAEGAALICLAALLKDRDTESSCGVHPFPYPRAALCLAAMLLVVNAGGAIGAAMTHTSASGYWLVAVVLAAVCLPLSVTVARRRTTPPQPATSTPPATQPDSAEEPLPEKPPVPLTPWSSLTRRECEIAELLVQGKSTPEICRDLFISDNTVRTHIKNIYHKTRANNREQLKDLLRNDA